MPPRTVARLLPAVLLLWASAASAQLCLGVADPCVISTNENVASGTILDIGDRGLVIAASKTLNVQGAGILTILAGSLTLEDGAKIVAGGASGLGGIVTVLTTGAVTLRPNSQVDVRSGNGGTFEVITVVGDILMHGRILAMGTLREGLGGDVSLVAFGGGIQVGGLGINATGGDRFAGGGEILLDALGDVVVTGQISAIGSDGGTFEVFAGGNISVPSGVEINLRANDVEFGDGGDLCLEAEGNIVFGGTILSNGSGDGPVNGGGDGGFLDVFALGDIDLGGTIEAKGSADGGGGALDLDGMNLDVSANVTLTGPGQGDGGDVFFLATQDIFVDGVLDVRAGISGGSFSSGGTIDVITDGDIDLASTAVLLTTGTFRAGTTDFFGCDVTITNGALIESLGPPMNGTGTNTVQASGLATIGGVVQASAANSLRYRQFAPVVSPQAGTSPPWNVAVNGSLPCCISCPTTTTTSTSSSTSSTTSSSTSSSISTSSTSSISTSSTSSTTTTLPTTSTTSSTTVVSTTTTTLPPTTSTTFTTSSTSVPATTTSSTTSTLPTTTSTIATTTTTTTTVSSSSTTSTVASTTSSTATTLATTTTVVTSTTTTTLPATCTELPLMGFEAAACALGILEEDVSALSDDDLGGKRPARRLRKRIEKSVVLLERANVETKLKKTRRFVKRSRKKLQSFEKKVGRFGSKGKIVLSVAEELIDASTQARVRIEAIEVELRQQ